ncbi:hypothetical protein [Kitasatospora sp. NPDC096140]|uniref:hypothetical protein n=1 Tax=Kitasatospora sp. NPDC096140 TaxID=3155425 RepID=UPI00331A102E
MYAGAGVRQCQGGAAQVVVDDGGQGAARAVVGVPCVGGPFQQVAGTVYGAAAVAGAELAGKDPGRVGEFADTGFAGRPDPGALTLPDRAQPSGDVPADEKLPSNFQPATDSSGAGSTGSFKNREECVIQLLKDFKAGNLPTDFGQVANVTRWQVPSVGTPTVPEHNGCHFNAVVVTNRNPV